MRFLTRLGFIKPWNYTSTSLFGVLDRSVKGRLIFIVVVIVLVVFQWWSQRGITQGTDVNTDESTAPQAMIREGSKGADLEHADLPNLAVKTNVPALWALADEPGLVILQRAHQIHAQAIALDEVFLKTLKVGDGFSVRIPQTQRVLTASVTDKRLSQFSETLFAEVDGSTGSLHIQLTFSASSVFGNIETPEGVYVLEKQTDKMNGVAVIFDQNEIYDQLDYAESDAIELSRRPQKIGR